MFFMFKSIIIDPIYPHLRLIYSMVFSCFSIWFNGYNMLHIPFIFHGWSISKEGFLEAAPGQLVSFQRRPAVL